MIAYLRGTLIRKEPNRVIIEANGVGYSAAIPISTFTRLGDVRTEVELHIHTHLTDDSIVLFGFATEEEKNMFLKLTQVSGIGPQAGHQHPVRHHGRRPRGSGPNERHIAADPWSPGIGKKTALRLAMELADKLEKKEKVLAARDAPERSDLISALQNMGLQAEGSREDSGREPDLRQKGRRLRQAPARMPAAPGQDMRGGMRTCQPF